MADPKKRPTKDVTMAAVRLEKAAAHLICCGMNYGGSLHGDILAVVQTLNKLLDATPPPGALRTR